MAKDLPIFGAPAPKPTTTDTRKAQQSRREQERHEKFKRDALKEVPWQKRFRVGNAHQPDWILFEAVYRGFRQRLLEDPGFMDVVLDRVTETLMGAALDQLTETLINRLAEIGVQPMTEVEALQARVNSKEPM